MSDDVKIILVWLGVPVVGALISCILGWLATVSHKKIRREQILKEYHINLTNEQRKGMNGGKEIKIQLDDDTVLYLTKTVKRQSLQTTKEYNQSYYLRNKEHIQELRRINRKKRKEAGLIVNYQTKEYAHDYYMRVTKPKRQKQEELKGK